MAETQLKLRMCYNVKLKFVTYYIMHSSTLKTLSVGGFTKLPTTLFLPILHLTTLELTISPNDFCDSLTLEASKGVPVVPIASHTVIDRFVWHSSLEKEYIHGTRLPSSALSH